MSSATRRIAIASLVVAPAALVSISSGGCFVVAELSRFHPQPGDASVVDAGDGDNFVPGVSGEDDPARPSSLVVTLVNMGVHFQQDIEVRVIDSENAIQSRVFVKPLDELGKDRVTIHVPGAVPTSNRPCRLDFYADVNRSGSYDGIGNILLNDHAWRVEPLADYPGGFAHVPNVVQVTFLHSKSFTDIDKWPTGKDKNPPTDTGLGARIAFAASSLALYRGRLLQVRIEETRTGHTVATYRVPQIPAEDFVAAMPGVLDIETDYYVKVYIDANGNNTYDNPASNAPTSDLGFVMPVRSSVDAGVRDGGAVNGPLGIDTTFDLSRTFLPSNADVGEP